MINEAQVFVAGYVATQPTFRTTSRGKPEAQMRVGYTPRRQNWETGEWSDGPSSFVSVKCWGRLANNVAVCLRKGEPVVVMGRVQVRTYESKNGTERLSVDVYASSIGYDLARGVARFSRIRLSSGETAADRQANGVSAAAPGRQDGGDPEVGDLNVSDLEVSDLEAPAPDETAGGGFINDRALAALAQQGDDEPSGNSAPF
jgi:single stranded DNA-binding protein